MHVHVLGSCSRILGGFLSSGASSLNFSELMKCVINSYLKWSSGEDLFLYVNRLASLQEPNKHFLCETNFQTKVNLNCASKGFLLDFCF